MTNTTTQAAMLPPCSFCGRPQTEPGALVFSPPGLDASCFKLHCCTRCWSHIIALQRQIPTADPAEQEPTQPIDPSCLHLAFGTDYVRLWVVEDHEGVLAARSDRAGNIIWDPLYGARLREEDKAWFRSQVALWQPTGRMSELT